MSRSDLRVVGKDPLPPLQPRGYTIMYRGSATSCPSCGRSQWHIGRTTVECEFCGTALGLGSWSAEPIRLEEIESKPIRMTSAAGIAIAAFAILYFCGQLLRSAL